MARSKILIVDDNSLYRMVTKGALEDGPYEILEGSDGKRGLDLAREHVPDLIISDLLMPAMDGYEFLRRLRADPQVAHIKVIFYTATFSGVDEAALSKLGGVICHLVKPVSPEDLQRIVRDALAMRPEKTPELGSDFEQEHLRVVTNQLKAKVDALEHANEELRTEVERRCRAEKSAILSKNFFQAMADSIPQLAWQLHANEKFEYVNKRFRDFHEIRDPVFDLNRWEQYVHLEDRADLRGTIQLGLRRGEEFTCEARLLRASDLAFVPHWVSAIPMKNPDGACVWFGTCTDISTQKSYEHSLIQLKNQAESLSRAKTEFLNNISHEIRTPLNAIAGFTQLLLDDIQQPEPLNLLRRIDANTGRLNKLLTDVITLSELESGSGELRAENFSLKAFLQMVEADARALANSKGLDFVSDVPACEDMLRSHPETLRRILGHLLSNAVKFTRAGQIEMRARVCHISGNQLSLLSFEVQDTGIGIDSSQRARLFQPFSQMDGSRGRRQNGQGLGLMLSRKLAEVIGGRLELVTSTSGIGSCFRLVVPVTEAYQNRKSESDLSQIGMRF